MKKQNIQYGIILISVILGYFAGGFYDSSLAYFFPEANSGSLAITYFIMSGLSLFILLILLNKMK